MANTSFNAAGVPLTVTKSTDGTLYAYSNSFPNVGAEAGTSGNFSSGPLTSSSISAGITDQRQFILNEQATISIAERELRILQTNPASILGVNFTQTSLQFAINQQNAIITASIARIAGAERVIQALNDLNANLATITNDYNQANPPVAGQSAPEAVPPPNETVVENQISPGVENGVTNPPLNPEDDPTVVTPDEVEEANLLTEPPLVDDDAFDGFDEPGTVLASPALIDLGEEEAEPFFNGGLTEPPIVDDDAAFDEFAGVDEAVEVQRNIAINTSGLPVLAEDGSVAEGVAINPETGETFTPLKPDTGPNAPFSDGSSVSIDANKKGAQSGATEQDATNFRARQDWRVRLSLAPGAKYLYNTTPAGILAPLGATDGVIFPYTPTISVSYSASYDPSHPTHSNYKVYQYNNSAVDSISITGMFTAQDTYEANYLLAVIHFFRTVTKMFYGQDSYPKPGTPPPLCYLFGYGAYQFDAHPLVITNFTYSLPEDVDYIKAAVSYGSPGVNRAASNSPNNSGSPSANRLGTGVGSGGAPPQPQFANGGTNTPSGSTEPTYVPTRIQLTVSAVPVISRNQISNQFSVKKYATGELLRGTKRSGGGIW